LDIKFNFNYKTAIIYDYKNTIILIYYSLIYYPTTLIRKDSIKHSQPLDLSILLFSQSSMSYYKTTHEQGAVGGLVYMQEIHISVFLVHEQISRGLHLVVCQPRYIHYTYATQKFIVLTYFFRRRYCTDILK
jgi:hypothetical protein